MDPDGTLEQQGDRAVVRFERRLNHPIDRVWSAVTEPHELSAWLGDAAVDLEQGGRFDIRWRNTDEDGNSAHRQATITRLEPPHLIETDGDPHGTLRFELRPDGDQATVLVFTSILDLPDEFRTQVVAGWHWHLDALAAALDTGERADLEHPMEAGWQPIHEAYVSRH